MFRLQVIAWLLVSTFGASSQSVAQDLATRIRFDVPALIHCREVTTEEFASTHSLEKLLEVRIRVSSLVENGSDSQIQELFLFAYSPERSFRIVDLTPQTTLISEFAGPIEFNENKENSNNAGFQFVPPLEFGGKATLNANLADRQGQTRKTSKLPPKQVVVASGTQKRQSAAYFKFKPNSQITLEGEQEISLIISVPLSWRADVLHMHCRAITSDREMASGKNSRTGRVSREDFVVPLHVENDAAAKIACENYLLSERNLRRLAMNKVRSSKKSARRSGPFSELEKWVSLTLEPVAANNPPALPSNWLGQIIFSQDYSRFAKQLPQEVRMAAKKLFAARETITQLNR